MAAPGMSPARFSVLSVLVFGGARTLGELARVEQVRPPTMTKLVRGLERDGLVRCAADARDGRVVRVEATATGTRVMHEGRRLRVEAFARLLEALDERELSTLAAAARRLGELRRLPGGRGPEPQRPTPPADYAAGRRGKRVGGTS